MAAEGTEQSGQTNTLPRSRTFPEWQYPTVENADWTKGGTSNKDAVIHALEIAMLDHVERLLHGTLATPDPRQVIQFEAGLRRLKDLDPVMRQIVDKVYDGRSP